MEQEQLRTTLMTVSILFGDPPKIKTRTGRIKKVRGLIQIK